MVAIIALGLLASASGLLLGFAAVRFRVEGDPIVEQIDAILPQTQCGQCGYAGCRPYAEAIAAGEADINQCPPGGQVGISALADLLGRDPKPLNPDNGAEKPKMVAVIDEQNCIGCMLCIQACPVDAILGTAKHLHTVIASECTGCELCLAPCPVDCIHMTSIPQTLATWKWAGRVESLPGTPFAELIDHCGGNQDGLERLIMGGRLMGFALQTDQAPVTKATNCILAARAAELAPEQPVMPCIRCGACAGACPVNLLPQQLYWHARAREFDKAQDYHLFSCLECGCCSYVCPSHIPLVQYYRYAKNEIWAREKEKEKAELARRRHQSRVERLEREKQERETRLRRKAPAKATPVAGGGEEGKLDLEAAVARARPRRGAAEEGGVPASTWSVAETIGPEE